MEQPKVNQQEFAPTERRATFDKNFNTIIPSGEEQGFQDWKTKNAPNDTGEDYDLRGAFKGGLTRDPQNSHMPDTYKKPNHPTFSNESQYAPYGNPGSWSGDKFTPHPNQSKVYTHPNMK